MKPRSDEGKRGHLAVAISVVEEDDAYVLFFDDVHLTLSNDYRTWAHKLFVTSAVVPKEKFQAMNFSDEEMAGMGLTILGSLHAMYKMKNPKAPPSPPQSPSKPATSSD